LSPGRLLLFALLLPAASIARRPPPRKHAPPPAPSIDPARFFAARAGLVRIYEGRSESKREDDDLPPAGASCEVLEARPRDQASNGSVKESCTMIVGRKSRGASELTYELRRDGIWTVQVKPEGGEAQSLSRLVLPGPLKVGTSWKEPSGEAELDRTVRSAGCSCHAAGRSFADCLVLAVVQKQGASVVRRYTETYAAGVGLVEDAQWELVDVKGL